MGRRESCIREAGERGHNHVSKRQTKVEREGVGEIRSGREKRIRSNKRSGIEQRSRGTHERERT